MKPTMDTIGCDIGDKTSALFLRGPDGTSRRLKSVATTREGFEKFFKVQPPAHVVIEMGTHSRWISQLLTELGHSVTIADSYRLSLISRNHRKSDDVDAELLARLGSSDVTLLSPIVHRSDRAQLALAELKAREALVEVRTKLVNHIRGAVKQFGSRLPTVSAESFHRTTYILLPEALRAALVPLYDSLTHLAEQIKSFDKKIEKHAKEDPTTKRLMEVPGVGPIVASTYVCVIDDPNRFSSSRSVASYLGLVPRRGQSGDHDPQMRISKKGDSRMRKLLVIAANRLLGPFGKECELRQWGLELAKRGGKNAKHRAKVAVARRLATLLHRLWVSKTPYDPFFQQTKKHPTEVANVA